MKLERHQKPLLVRFFVKLTQLHETGAIKRAEFDRKNNMEYYHDMMSKGHLEPTID